MVDLRDCQPIINTVKINISQYLIYACIVTMFIDISQGQVNIITQPMNVTVCLTQSTTATFTCVVDRGGVNIFNAGWSILDGGIFVPIPQNRRPRHMTNDTMIGDIITDTLTVTDVSVDDNGAQYRCEPANGVNSMTVTIIVLAFPPDVIEVTDICTNDFTVLWNSTEGLTYIVIILPPSMINGTSVGPTMDTTHTFTDLMPNTVYAVSVTSMMDTCTGIPNTVMVTTLSEEVGLPQSVSNLRNSVTTNTTIIITWNPAISPSDCGPVLYYNVIATSLANASDRNTIVTSQTIAGLSGLRNGTSYNISVAAVNRAGSGPSSTIIVRGNSIAAGTSIDDSDDDASLSTGVAVVIAAVSSCVVSVVITAIITFLITAHFYKKKYSASKQNTVKQPKVSKTGVMEYEEITKRSPDNVAMTTNPSYDVAMTSNPAYDHNVKNNNQQSHYYN